MYNILAISPISIAGALIINGLAKGFGQLGNNVLSLDVRELDFEAIRNFKPDFAIGYDYAHFVIPEAEEVIRELNIPVIHYFADDPHANFAHSGNLELIKKLASSNNTVYCWDKQHISAFRNKVFYLPLAVDPDLYEIKDNSRMDLEIVFVGRPLTDRRLTLLSSIVRNFPGKLHIYSYQKHFDMSAEEMERLNLLEGEYLKSYKNSYKGFLQTEKELAQVYADSKIVLNITMEQGLSSMNYRVLEVLASGGFLLTDFKQDTAEYFSAEEDLVFYKDREELIERISKYIQDDTTRAEIARSGKEKVLKNHTSKQRARYILSNLDLE